MCSQVNELREEEDLLFLLQFNVIGVIKLKGLQNDVKITMLVVV